MGEAYCEPARTGDLNRVESGCGDLPDAELANRLREVVGESGDA